MLLVSHLTIVFIDPDHPDWFFKAVGGAAAFGAILPFLCICICLRKKNDQIDDYDSEDDYDDESGSEMSEVSTGRGPNKGGRPKQKARNISSELSN